MKNKYALFVYTIICAAFISCKKENNNSVAENNNSVIGKWQEFKLRVYTTASTGAILNDTTYSAQAFTNLDYVQFASNGLCTLSSSHYYMPAGQGAPLASLAVGMLNYTGQGPVYSLATNTSLTSESILWPQTATIINSNSLLLRDIAYTFGLNTPYTTYDAYYSK